MRWSKVIVIVGLAGLWLMPPKAQAEKGDPNKDVFVVKAQKSLVGGKVEVFTENGRLLTAQTMQARKMIIDFGDTKLGAYTIRLTKGDRIKEFRFIKK